MFAWLGLVLALGAFAITNLAVSLLTLGLWRVLRAPLLRLSAGRRADVLFGLRVLPSAAALLVAGGLVAPAYLLHEPAKAGETPGLALLALAGIGALLLALGTRHVVSGRWATQRFLADRLAAARPLDLAAAPAPAFRVGRAFPAIMLVGVARPRLLVAEPVLAQLTGDELAVALAHEAGHLAARDNLKALLARAAVFWGGLGAPIEHDWQEAAEQAADDRAVSGSAVRAVSLAAALVKVAKMSAESARIELPATALHQGEGVKDRVERLLYAPRHREPAADPAGPPRALLFALFGLAAASLPAVLPAVHGVLEHVVRRLP